LTLTPIEATRLSMGVDDDGINPQGLVKNFANEKRNNGS
jgi:hypothetical protein